MQQPELPRLTNLQILDIVSDDSTPALTQSNLLPSSATTTKPDSISSAMSYSTRLSSSSSKQKRFLNTPPIAARPSSDTSLLPRFTTRHAPIRSCGSWKNLQITWKPSSTISLLFSISSQWFRCHIPSAITGPKSIRISVLISIIA